MYETGKDMNAKTAKPHAVVWQSKSSVTNTSYRPSATDGRIYPRFLVCCNISTTLPLLRQAFVAIRLQGGPMQKAQRIIKTYRRNRMIVCTFAHSLRSLRP